MDKGHRLLLFAACIALAMISFGLGAMTLMLHQNAGEIAPYVEVLDTSEKLVKYPCRDVVSRDESELCAQWQAAAASDKSAFLALCGVVVTSIGSVLLLWQIGLTREALTEADKATAEAQRANEIARGSLRPWLSFEDPPSIHIQYGGWENGKSQFGLMVPLSVSNHGQSPALTVRVAIENVVAFYDSEQEFIKLLRSKKLGYACKPIQPSETVAIGDKMWIAINIESEKPEDKIAAYAIIKDRSFLIMLTYKSKYSNDILHYGDGFYVGARRGVHENGLTFELQRIHGHTDAS